MVYIRILHVLNSLYYKYKVKAMKLLLFSQQSVSDSRINQQRKKRLKFMFMYDDVVLGCNMWNC